ncbi:hypothetical protein ACP70R_033079 [Stipagrostis hirtigluma subsp. patula]
MKRFEVSVGNKLQRLCNKMKSGKIDAALVGRGQQCSVEATPNCRTTPSCRIKRIVEHSAPRHYMSVISSDSSASLMDRDDDFPSPELCVPIPVVDSSVLEEVNMEEVNNIITRWKEVFNKIFREVVEDYNRGCSTPGNMPWNAGHPTMVPINVSSSDDSDREEDGMLYPLSPFSIAPVNSFAPVNCILDLMRLIPAMGDEDLERSWFIHDHPTTINLNGYVLQSQFCYQNDLTGPVVDAIVRLFTQEDNSLYPCNEHKRWRHFVGSYWSEDVVAGKCFPSIEEVKDWFCGTRTSYSVQDCRMVIAPVFNGTSWSSYVWDFWKKTINVIDPSNMFAEYSTLDVIHRECISELHRALLTCVQAVSLECSVVGDEWETNYIMIEGGGGPRCYSGIFSLFYALVFDGNSLTDTLTRESVPFCRCNILYKMLSMVGNMGQPPSMITG